MKVSYASPGYQEHYMPTLDKVDRFNSTEHFVADFPQDIVDIARSNSLFCLKQSTGGRQVKFGYSSEGRVSAELLSKEGVSVPIRSDNLPQELAMIRDPRSFDLYFKDVYIQVLQLSDGDYKISIGQRGLGGGPEEEIRSHFQKILELGKENYGEDKQAQRKQTNKMESIAGKIFDLGEALGRDRVAAMLIEVDAPQRFQNGVLEIFSEDAEMATVTQEIANNAKLNPTDLSTANLTAFLMKEATNWQRAKATGELKDTILPTAIEASKPYTKITVESTSTSVSLGLEATATSTTLTSVNTALSSTGVPSVFTTTTDTPTIHLFSQPASVESTLYAQLAGVHGRPALSILSSQPEDELRFKESLNNIWNISHTLRRYAQDPEAIMVCGDTGSGKSTLVNYLLNCTMIAKKANNSDTLFAIECRNPATDIGHGHSSRTFVPTRCSGSAAGIYWDCPGFEDTHGPSHDVCNAFGVAKIGEKAANAKILVVIEEGNLLNMRGGPFRSIISKITKMFSNKPDLADNTVFCFTKARGRIANYEVTLRDIIDSKDYLSIDEKSFLRAIVDKKNFVVFHSPTKEGEIDDRIKQQLIGKLGTLQFIKDPVVSPIISVNSLQYLNKLSDYTNHRVTDALNDIGTIVSKALSITQDLSNFVEEFIKVTQLVLSFGNTTPDANVLDAFSRSLICLEFGSDNASVRSNINEKFAELKFLSTEVLAGLFGKYLPGREKFPVYTLVTPFIDMVMNLNKALTARGQDGLKDRFFRESGFLSFQQRVTESMAQQQARNVDNQESKRANVGQQYNSSRRGGYEETKRGDQCSIN